MKTIVITGATSGIGLASAKRFGELGYRQVWLIRDVEKAKNLLPQIEAPVPVTLIRCDLSDLASVKEAARELLAAAPQIDVLLNNAGGMFDHKALSKDGYELSFAMNHLGHFLLVRLIIDRLIESKARVVSVSSDAHRIGKINLGDVHVGDFFTPLKSYADAKLCNIYFTKELHRRYNERGITTYALHPGVVKTGFASGTKGFFSFGMKLIKPFMITPEKGARTSVYLATENGIENLSGGYFKNGRPNKPSAEALNTETAQKVWALSEQLTQPFMG